VRRVLSIGVLSAIVLARVSASAVYAAPLDSELHGLIASHPLIKSGQAQLSAAEQGVKASLAPFLPSLDVSAGGGYEHTSTPTFRASPDGLFKEDAENWSVTLRENVYDGGRKFANRRASFLQQDLADITLTTTRQTVLLEGVTAYVNVLRQAELLNLSSQNAENIRKQLSLEDERVRRGSGIAVDVLQAKSRLQISLERQTAIQGALDDASSRYLQVFGHMPSLGDMALAAWPERLLPTIVDDAVSAALNENPTVTASSRRIDITAEQRNTIEAEYYPNVDLVLLGKYEEDFNGVPGIRRDYTAKLQMSWNLFSGFSTQARSSQASYDQEARRSEYVQARRKAEESARLAWHALQTANERVVLLENAVNIAAEVFDSRNKLREAGKESSINVLDAESELFNSRINHASASFDARIAAYQLLAAMGRLELETIVNP